MAEDDPAETTNLQLSPEFRLQIEYNYQRLLSDQTQKYKTTMLKKKDFVALFRELEDAKDAKAKKVGPTLEELQYLEYYFDMYKDRDTNRLGAKDLLDEFGMTDRMDLMKMELLDHCRAGSVQALSNKKLTAQKYEFKDLVLFLQNIGFDLSKADVRLKSGGHRAEVARR
jgi:hypothetical protein